MNDSYIGVVILASLITVPLVLWALFKPILRAVVLWMLADLGEDPPDMEELSLTDLDAVGKRWVQKRLIPRIRR